MPNSNTLIGKTIFDRYRIDDKLGKGGRGEVYLAYDTQLEGKVAVKRLLDRVIDDDLAMQRFRKEPVITNRLRGPYVVYVHAFDKDKNLEEYFSVMEYVPDGTLRDLLHSEEQLSISEALNLGLEICKALDWIHRRQVVHRDLKPSNILIAKEAEFPIRLADFGIAYRLDESEEKIPQGTPFYASPEQLDFNENSEPLDVRSDLYSLGIMLYEMLTGDPPFIGGMAEVIMSQIIELPPPPIDFRSDLLPSLNDLILKALAKNPNERFQSAQEMSKSIKAIIIEEQQRQAKLEYLYPLATEAFVERDWDIAMERLSEIVEMNPIYEDAGEKLKISQQEKQLQELYHKATGLIKEKIWTEAKGILTKIHQIRSDYQDVEQKLERIEQEITLAELYDKGIKFQAERDWIAAQSTYVHILTIDASYSDVANRLVETQEQQKLEYLYNEALQSIEQEEWGHAVGNLEQIVAKTPDYDDAKTKLEHAQKQAKLAKLYNQGETYEESQDWARALGAYKQVTDLDSHHKDAAIRQVEVEKRLEIRTNYEVGDAAFSAGDWEKAVSRFKAVWDADPDYKDIAVKLERAQRQLEITEKYNLGLQYFEQGDLRQALEHLMWVTGQEPDYENASKLINEIQQRLRLDALASDAQRVQAAGQWEEAIKIWDRILETNPDYPNAVHLQLGAKLGQTTALYEQDQWQQVVNLADEILEIEPDYEEALQLKLDALFHLAVAARKARRWQEVINITNQILIINPKYSGVASLRRRAKISQLIFHPVRFRFLRSPVALVGILLLAIGSVAIFLLISSEEIPQIIKAEVLINGEKINPRITQHITNKDEVEIKVQTIDINGNFIPNAAITCEWSFIPTPEPIDFRTQDECIINYTIPTGLKTQSVRGEVKSKKDEFNNTSRVTVKFDLSEE